MDDPYDWKNHKPTLAHVAILFLIYATMLAVLFLLVPLPWRETDFPVATTVENRRVGKFVDDDRDELSSDALAALHCNRKPVRVMNARFCAGGR